jgi:hypothetical protein
MTPSSPHPWAAQAKTLLGLGGLLIDFIAKALKLWHEITH